MRCRAVFRPIALINGGPVTRPVSNIKFSTSSPPFGQSGIASIQLDFDIYDPELLYVGLLGDGEICSIADADNQFAESRIFYLVRRSHSDKITHISARDVTSKSDMPFDKSDINFNAVTDPPTVGVDDVLDAIRQQCGFASVHLNVDPDMRFTEEMLTEKTCRQILEMIAEPVCGVWISGYDGSISLQLWGRSVFSDHGSSETYTEVDPRGEQMISSVTVTNTETGESEMYNGENYGIAIGIITPFYDQAIRTAADIIAMSGAAYSAWNCERALLSPYRADMAAFSNITLDTARYAFDFYVDVDSTGIYFSGGADPQDEQVWQYKTKMQREISQRVKIGQTVGNTQVSEKGIIFVDKNAASTAKYGFTVGSGGVTEYEGAIVNKITPKSAEFTDNTVTVAYGGKTWRYTLTFDSSGNITSFSKEEVAG